MPSFARLAIKCAGLVELGAVLAFSMASLLASNASQMAIVASLGSAPLAFLLPGGCGQDGVVCHDRYVVYSGQ